MQRTIRTIRRTRTTRPLTLTAATVGAALALSGCAGGTDREVDPGVDVGTDARGEEGAGTGSESDRQADADAAEDDGTGEGGDAAGSGISAPERPQPGSCIDIGEPDDGVYQVFEAGSATIVVRENRLVLESVDPAAGWEYDVDEEDDDEIEIEFRRTDADDELDLEVEIDDGRVTAEICADDD